MANILVVDDSLDLLDFLSSLLTKNGINVKNASTKEQILGQLNSFTPDVIILDVKLGDCNGRDVCREIKSMFEKIHIILISANPEYLIDFTECNADDVIEKPFNLKHVLQKINKYVPQCQLVCEN